MCNTYTPLHLHTNFSPDGLGTIENMMDYAKSAGFKSLAITDHGTCGGHVSFWSAARERGIKTLFGNEVYILNNGKRGHLTVLARNQEGYKNLLALNNRSYLSKDRGFPTITLDDISEFKNGLVVLSGCSASPLYHGTDADAMVFAGALYDILGADNFYAEVMGVIAEDNYSRPKMISEHLGLKMVITNDTHFTRKQDANAHTIMCISRKGFDYTSGELYLKTREEMLGTKFLQKYAGNALLEQLLDNTNTLADEFENIDLSGEPKLPSASSEVNILQIAVDKELERGTSWNSRLEYEINVIEKQCLVDYFTILFDIVEYCKSNGIKVGPGRGSGAGSYFLYLLGITDIDPIEHGLMFERFLNPDRSDMADFDLDVEANRRDEVIQYANEKWGAWPIANYSTYSHASLIRDIGRFFNVPLNEVSIAADSEDEEVLDKFFSKCETTHSTAGVSKKLTPADARRAYDVMLGQIRHRGKHAGGVVIATRDVPIEDEKVAWVEGVHERQLSKVGLVKYDILGVTALSQIAEMEKISGTTPGNPWDSDSQEVFESIFHSGRTEGVFQFGGSSGIVQLTQKVMPTTLADLSAINALYRPGPLDSGMAWKYPDYKISPRKIHPDIDAILDETYGIIVYQEQVMAIVAKITGGSLADADNARKIISKGKPGDKVWEKKMRELQKHFKDKGYLGYSKSLVDTLWDEIVTFGRYGFNKSHSTAYSLVSYRMAWFKHFYPHAFYTALLNGDSENADRWLYAAAQDGIKVKHPDINNSGVNWTTDGVGIYAPLVALKYFGEKQASEFVILRGEHGKYKDFSELESVPKRVINSRVRRQLYLGGALNGITGDIAAYIPAFEELLSMSKAEKEVEALGYRLPGDLFIDFFNKETKLGKVVGFVSDIEKRNKGRGDYYVVRLTPKYTFWTRDATKVLKLNKWDLVSVEVNGNGESKNIWRKRE